jgi:hypothetical protein
LAIAGGTKPLHDLISRIEKPKDDQGASSGKDAKPSGGATAPAGGAGAGGASQ